MNSEKKKKSSKLNYRYIAPESDVKGLKAQLLNLRVDLSERLELESKLLVKSQINVENK